jgi:hypothetical protein
MIDPHVERLHYRLETDSTLQFDKPSRISLKTPDFQLDLADGVLVLTPNGHFADEASARAAAQPLLDAWEISVALERGRRDMRFVFESADIMDRSPPPPGVQVCNVGMAIEVDTAVGLTFTVIAHTYPEPPKGFVAGPEVVAMWHRYERSQSGGEPLASMAFACLSMAQHFHGGRKALAARLGIDLAVLDCLGQLSSEVGDRSEARKFDQSATFRPHTPAEKEWIQAAVRVLILRMGERAAGPNAALPPLTMTDLPKL